MIRRLAAAATAMLAASSLLLARQTAPAPTFERPVNAAGTGPYKLPIDVPLLSGGQRFTRLAADSDSVQAHGGLGDLRLVDADGRELPYLLLAPPTRRVRWIAGRVLPIAQTEKTSGFEVDLGALTDVDAMAVDGLPSPFLKRFGLEGSGDRSRWTMLIEQGTLFDLPDERVRQTDAVFDRGRYRYLRLTWDDTNSGRIRTPSTARAREASPQSARDPMRVPVTFERQASEPGRSRYRLQLPAAGWPVVALVIDPGAGDVFRIATVMETRFNGERADPVELGRARLARAEGRSPAASALRIRTDAPRTSELQLVIDNANNPPLDLQRIEVELAELPWIYFEAPGRPVTARYGDPAAQPPQYDLEARRSSIDLDGVREASWGEARALAAADRPVAPADAIPDRGANLDLSGFRHRRTIDSGAAGLSMLQLDASVLSHSRGPAGNFADVRVVDARGAQVPYLLERRAEPLSVELATTPATPSVPGPRDQARGQRSYYAITLPYPDLPETRLVLETSERVFRRTLQVGVERRPDRQRRDPWFDQLASRSWQHADQRVAAPPLDLAIAPGDQTRLLLIVEEGDNRPLPITSVRLLLPSWRIRFFRPAEALRLVYGKSDLPAPRYDLALLAPAVMGGAAREASASPEEGSRTEPADLLSPRVFWIGLGAAVLVLLALIVRLMGASASPSGSAPPPSPPVP